MLDIQRPLCACGCGEHVKNDRWGQPNRFVTGHNSRMGRRKQWPRLICDNCQTEYETNPYRLNQPGSRRYCSTQCRDDFRRSGRGVTRHPLKVRACKLCGASYVHDKRRSRGYCSPECGAEGKRRALRQRRQEIVLGQHAKDRAKERDGMRCVVCGFDAIVHGHHIIPRAAGGSDDLSNLVTLCPNHHAMAHAGLLSDEDLRAKIRQFDL